MAGLSLPAYSIARDSLRTAVVSELLSTSLEKQSTLDAWILDREHNIADIASQSDLKESIAVYISAPKSSLEANLAYDELLQKLENWAGEGHHFLYLSLLDAQTGRILVSTDAKQEGKFKERESYFIHGRQATYIQNPYYDLSLGSPVMTAATPILSPDGDIAVVLAGLLNMDEMNAIFQRRTGLHQSDDAFLVNTAHLFVTQPYLVEESTVLQRSLYTEAIGLCLAHNSGVIDSDDYRDVPSIIVYHWLPERQLCLITKIEQEEAYAPSRTMSQTMAVTGGLVMLIGSITAFVMSRRITRPVLDLVQGVELIGQGNLAYRIEVKSSDEIGQLGEAFNEMAISLNQVEDALLLSNERLQYLISSSPTVIYTRKASGNFGATFISENVAELMGYPPQDFIDDSEFLADHIHPADSQYLFVDLENPNKDKYYTHEFRFLHKDGSYRWIRDDMRLVRNDSGEPLELVGSWIDITERKLSESEIERRLTDLHTLNVIGNTVSQTLDEEILLSRSIDEILQMLGFEIGALMLFDEEEGGMVLAAHRGFSADLGQTANRFKLAEDLIEKVSQTGEAVLIPDIGTSFSGVLNHYIDKERFRSEAIVPLMGSTGLFGTMSLAADDPDIFTDSGLKLLTAIGKQIGVGLEKTRLIAALRKSEQSLANAQEIARLGSWDWNIEENVLTWSAETYRQYGLNFDGIVPTIESSLSFVHPEDRDMLNREMEQALSGEKPFSVEARMQRIDGTEWFMHAQGTVSHNDEGEAVRFIGTQQDITQHKELRDRLARSEKLAILGQLAGGVGHELRNPLGAIKNAAYFLNMSIEETDPETREMLEILQSEVTKSEGIISDLLDFARTKPPTRRKTILNKAIQETLSQIEIPERIELISELTEDLPVILADPAQLEQIFSNIIHNAIQAMSGDGRLTVETRLESPGWLAVTIADTGLGMPPGTLAKIFEPLFTTRAKGIGLGLAIVKTLIEGHGGTIEVESKPGQGSRFTVRLPFQEKEKER
ncbi:MAG: PAS domain-containing protein [Anaerolineaceae bacterium]|nr:PAS domain-containing protein [Anaerolineaceae bacterium]